MNTLLEKALNEETSKTEKQKRPETAKRTLIQLEKIKKQLETVDVVVNTIRNRSIKNNAQKSRPSIPKPPLRPPRSPHMYIYIENVIFLDVSGAFHTFLVPPANTGWPLASRQPLAAAGSAGDPP